ncbi:MAG: hypothetical protein ACLTYH_07950 [Streptococcus salivarius]
MDNHRYWIIGNGYLHGVPFLLEGYYINGNILEEYRDWEGKSVEEWYGKRYLKKKKTQGVVGKPRMKKKSIFKANFMRVVVRP